MPQLIECTVSYPVHLEDVVSAAVSDFGIDDLVLGGSNLQSGTKPETSLTCYLEEETKVSDLENFIEKRIDESTLAGKISIQTSVVKQEEWEESWKQYWKPVTISEKLIVAPSWDKVAVSDNQTLISLDTTMAFGTGSHETTKLCLEFLLSLSENKIDSFLDVGCGSGVLAIAANKLGVKKVLGIDISDDIIETSQQNAAINDVDVSFSTTPLSETPGAYDLVCANIISSVLLSLWTDLTKRVAPGGKLLISGLLSEELDDFLVDARLEPIEVKTENDWAALLFQL